MSKIKIKNFGPIKDGFLENEGWLDIKKVTVFIGNQGSGKSTVAKLISTFAWIEKALTRGDFDIKWLTQGKRFKTKYCAYHKIESYFHKTGDKNTTEIEYEGNSFSIKYIDDNLFVEERNQTDYELPQIVYVPAERNFLSTVRSPKLLKLSSDSLMDFLTEFENAKSEIKTGLNLPINDAK